MALWGCVRARGSYPIGLRVDGVCQAEHRAYGGLALLAVRPAASLERGAQRVLGVGVRPLGCKELPQLRTHGERARRVLAERLAARVMHLRKEHRRRVGIAVGGAGVVAERAPPLECHLFEQLDRLGAVLARVGQCTEVGLPHAVAHALMQPLGRARRARRTRLRRCPRASGDNGHVDGRLLWLLLPLFLVRSLLSALAP